MSEKTIAKAVKRNKYVGKMPSLEEITKGVYRMMVKDEVEAHIKD